MSNKQVIFGIHAVASLLENQSERALRVFIQRDRKDEKTDSIARKAAQLDIPVEYLPKKEIDKLSQDANHQGVIAYSQQARVYDEQDLQKIIDRIKGPALFLVLDGVQDPHNLGACFRSADAAGVHAIIAPKDRAVGLTPVVSKVASGAMETVPFVQVTNIVRTLELLKEMGVWIYGMAGEADQSVFKVDLKGPAAIVMGAEGEGMRRLTREHCDVLMKIPMVGTVESLNVSVATGVVLFEALRQRKG